MPPVSEGLFVELKLIANEWSKGIKDAQEEAKQLEKSFKPLKEAANDLGKPMAAAGGAIVAAFVAATKVTADYGDMLNDARQKTGLTVESLAKLKFATDQSGSSFDGLQTGLKLLSKNIEAAAGGGKQQAQAFDNLGISVKNANGSIKPTEEILRAVSDKFATMKDGSAKTAAALQIFGKAGADLIPTLNAGSAGLDAMGAAAERAGVVISGDTATASDAFNDQVVELEASVKGLTMTVGSVLLPIIADALGKIIVVVQAVREWTAAHPELTKAVAALGVVLLTVGGALLGVGTVLIPLTAAFAAISAPVLIAVAAFSAFVAAFIAFPQVRAFVIPILKDIFEAVVGLGSILGSVGKAIYQLATGQFKTAFDTIKQSGTKALDDATSAADKFDKGVSFVSSSIADLKNGFGELPKPINDTGDALEKTGKKAKDAWSATDAFTIKVGEMRNVVNRVAEQIAAQAKALDDVDAAIKKASDSSKVYTAATREWGDMLATLNDQLKELPVNTQAAYNNLLILKPPTVDLGPTPEQIKAAQQRYDDIFNSVKDTASRTFTAIWNDGQIKFSALGDTIKGIFETLANEILSDMTAKLLTPLVNKIENGLGTVLGKIPGLGGVFGGGSGGGPTYGPAIPGVGGGGSIGGIAGSSLSLGSAGIMGIAAAAGGILGGILGNDRGAQRETAQNTLLTWGLLKDITEGILWPQFGEISAIAQSPVWAGLFDEIGYWATQIANVTAQWGQNIVNALGSLGSSGGGGGGGTVLEPSLWPSLPPAAGPASTTQPTAPAPQLGQGGQNTFSLLAGGDPGNNTFNLLGGFYPSYAMGTAYVPRTGFALLHQGEQVVPANLVGRESAMVNHFHIGTWLGDASGIDRLARTLARHTDKGGGRSVSSEQKR